MDGRSQVLMSSLSSINPRSHAIIVAERRRRRSAHPLQAVTYQLQHVRQEVGLQAVTLADELGVVIAAAGDTALVKALAFQAPWLAGRPKGELEQAMQYLWETAPNLKPPHLALASLVIDGERLYVAGVGKSKQLQHWIDHARRGVERILAAAL